MIKLKCPVCWQTFDSLSLFEHINSHPNEDATFIMKQTEVVVNLQVVQELIAHRLRYAFHEMVHLMSEAGIPVISIPKWDMARFGTNVYIVGFVEEHFDPNWIETFQPVSYIRMAQLPDFTRQRFQPKPRENTNWVKNVYSTIQQFFSFVGKFVLRRD